MGAWPYEVVEWRMQSKSSVRYWDSTRQLEKRLWLTVVNSMLIWSKLQTETLLQGSVYSSPSHKRINLSLKGRYRFYVSFLLPLGLVWQRQDNQSWGTFWEWVFKTCKCSQETQMEEPLVCQNPLCINGQILGHDRLIFRFACQGCNIWNDHTLGVVKPGRTN